MNVLHVLTHMMKSNTEWDAILKVKGLCDCACTKPYPLSDTWKKTT